MVLFPKRNNTPNQLASWLSQPKVSGKENLDRDLELAIEKSRKEYLMQKNAAPIDDDDFQPIAPKRIIPLRERQKRLRRQSSELSSLSSTRSTQRSIKAEPTDEEEEVLVDFNDVVKQESVVKKEATDDEEEEIVNFDEEELVVKKERLPEDDEEEVLHFTDFISQPEPVIKQEKPPVKNDIVYDIPEPTVDTQDDDDDDEDIEDLTNWTPSSQPPQIFTPSPSPPPQREPTPPPSRNKGKRRATPNTMPTPVEQLNIPKRKRQNTTTNQDPQCPLCLKRFAPDVIEEHASECLGATSSSTQSTRQTLIDEQFPTISRSINRQNDDESPIQQLARRRRQQQSRTRLRTPPPLPDDPISDIEGFSDENNNEADNQDWRTCPICGERVLSNELQDHVNAEMDRMDQNSSAEPRSSSTMGDLRDSFDIVNVSDDDDDGSIIDLSGVNTNQEEDDGYLSPLEGFVNINDRPEQFQQYFNQGLRQGSSSRAEGSSSRAEGSSSRQRRSGASSSRSRRPETPQQAARRRAKFARRNARASSKKRTPSTSKKYKKK